MCDTHKKHLDPNSPSHHEEHESWNRRTFLQALGIAGAGAFTLGGSQISSAMTSPITAAPVFYTTRTLPKNHPV